MTVPPKDLGTILVVGAHPDDETYLTAGLMAAAVRNGQRVATVTATRGEEGSFDEERWPTSEMGAVREKELMASLEVVGVTDHTWLEYHDGTCAAVDPAEGTAKVREQVERVRPDTVLTFGPDGMTGHPDHKAVCSWTTTALADLDAHDTALYYATYTKAWADEFVPVMNRFNVFMEEGTPPVSPPEDLAIDYELPPEILALKMRAIECHTSQVEGMLNAFGHDFFNRAMRAEFFRLARDDEA